MANPIPVNTRHARHQPQPMPPARPEPPMHPVPPREPDRGGGIGAGLRLIFGFFGLLAVLAVVFVGFILLENVLSPFITSSSPPVVLQPPPQPQQPANPRRVQQPPQVQPTAVPQRGAPSDNAGAAADSGQCSPPSRFTVGMTAIVDRASSSGASTRIAAWTEPGGGEHNSDAEPGAALYLAGGPQCVYNQRYRQYVRYWRVEFTNRNGRFVSGRAWVAESIWEGSSVNYLLCPTSQPDC